ncbi:MAG: enoyl-CoA hydratase/isomerase family protein [Acidimicrobiia bacterium]|nr:enoyl-CoA hydratase/isomerase family protein [Acidimicrobiia bacterium]
MSESSTTEPAVLVRTEGHVLVVELNRPHKRNAFDAEMLCRLADAWDHADTHPEVRAVVLTGAQGTFSAGADLDRLVGALMAGKEPANEYERRIRDDYSVIFKGFLKEHHLTKPLVAAVEGYCYAGGMEILLSADLRVAAEGATFSLSEVQRGLFPMAGSSVRLPRQLAHVDAMEILLLGEPMTAAHAERIRLVNRVVADGRALDEALRLAERLAANGPLAVQGIKEAAVRCAGVEETEAFVTEMEIGMRVMSSEDAREGPKAFLEKRTPKFTGR